MAIPVRVKDRIQKGLTKYKRIFKQLKDKDVNEANTVDAIADFIADVLGYDRYAEITREYAIRGTYCDLAILGEKDKVHIMIEAKAIGIALSDHHVKQAIDYCANEGVEWAILTNGEYWKIYKVKFGKPITKEQVAAFNLLEMNGRSQADLDVLFSLSKDGIKKSAIDDFYYQNQAKNKDLIAFLLMENCSLDFIRKKLKRIFPKAKVSNDEIKDILQNHVIKREIIECECTKEIKKMLRKV